MAEEETERIVIPDEEGNEHLFDVLFTFPIEELGHSYIVVTASGNQESEDEEIEILAFRYQEGDDEDDIALEEIETDEEWDMVEEMINTLADMEE